MKVSNPREIENLKGIKNLETVIERHEKVNETAGNVPKEVLFKEIF